MAASVASSIAASITAHAPPTLRPPLTHVTPTDQTGIIAILSGFTLGLLLLSIPVRLYARRAASLQRCDDGAFYTAVLLGLAEVGTTLYLVSRGLGRDPDLLSQAAGGSAGGGSGYAGNEGIVRRGVVATGALYVGVLCLSKVSCGLMYVWLTPFAGQKRGAWGLVWAAAVWGGIGVVVEAVGCAGFGGGCRGYRARWIWIAVSDALLEAALVGASIHMVYSRSMSARAKYTVVGAFAYRIPNIVITVVRLVFICVSDAAPTPAIHIARVQGATQLAIGYTVVSCVIPYLRPLMQSYEDDGRRDSGEATFKLSDRSKGSGSADLGGGKGKGKAVGLDFSDMGTLIGPERPGFVRLKSREALHVV